MSISIQNVYIFTLLNEGNSITMHTKMFCKSRVMNQKSDNLNPIFILYPSPVFGLTLLKSQSSFYFFFLKIFYTNFPHVCQSVLSHNIITGRILKVPSKSPTNDQLSGGSFIIFHIQGGHQVFPL